MTQSTVLNLIAQTSVPPVDVVPKHFYHPSMQNNVNGQAQRSHGISLHAFLATLITSSGFLLGALVIFAISVRYQALDIV